MSPTRRTLLRAALPLAAGLAGCSGAGSPDGPTTARPSGTERDPEVSKPRNLDGESVIESMGEDDGPAGNRELITDADSADSIEFAPGVPDEQVESTRAFLAATDFSAETVYHARATIESCYRFRIRSVTWEPGRVEYEYCRELRPATVRCESGTREAVGLFLRIPAVLEAEIRSAGAGGRSPCRDSAVDWGTIDATATEAPDR
ncbi:hypothetical protein [Halorarum salinum]|uniref:Uncharacterized protein n=1 Tax=Halorarum salinum TaxID=2743089 RepID=A0A7D5QJF3_9EURY|nr:hypothetical protein [Halobaculum salinum]QLG61385.1 hypothetical protein HUG12_06405 [Halobaculum salinum]